MKTLRHIAILVLLISILMTVYIIDKSFNSNRSNQTLTQINAIRIHTSHKDIISLISKYIKEVNPEIRDFAINIINNYINNFKNKLIIYKNIKVSAGESETYCFEGYEGLKYTIDIYVSGTCIGTCDIDVTMRSEDLGIFKYFGRISSLKVNVVPSNNAKICIELDNSYSIITSKTVYLRIRASTTKFLTLNNGFKVAVIALWFSERFHYINDPRGFEYIAPPTETMKTLSGDCDDAAVFLASMYNNIGLHAAVGLIDTDGDGIADHATALVKFNSLDDFEEALYILSQLTGREWHAISYFESRGSGVWVVIDPAFTYGAAEPWHIEHEPYRLVKIVDP